MIPFQVWIIVRDIINNNIRHNVNKIKIRLTRGKGQMQPRRPKIMIHWISDMSHDSEGENDDFCRAVRIYIIFTFLFGLKKAMLLLSY